MTVTADATSRPAALFGDAVRTFAVAPSGSDLIEHPDDLDARIVLRETDGRRLGTLRLDRDDGLLLAGDGDMLWGHGVAENGSAITAIRVPAG